MPLTHVSEWTNDKGMCRITPDEAADKYGKVSALDEILICDLCNQYVTLSTSKLGKSFFKHSRGDENKDCEERSKKISNFYSINKNQLETLDFRLNIEKKYIELIVPSIEFTNLSKDSYIIIDNTIKKILSQFYPSYIQVPLRGTYSIRFQNNQNSRLPDKINGFSKTAVFDGNTGKKLQENSDITTGKYYYVLTSDYSSYLNNGVNYNSIVCEDIRYNFIEGYRLFKIKITALNRQAGNFILKNFKLRLKNVLADLYPVWPPCINAPYKIYHNSSKIFMGLQGNYVMLKSYPHNGISQEPYSKPAIISILCSHKEYLLTMGRNNPWKQLYINRQDRLSEKAKKNLLIKIGVTDINGTEFQSGISHNLPKDGKIKIKADYDGKVVCIKRWQNQNKSRL